MTFAKAAGFTSLGLAVGISGFTKDASLKKIAPAVLKLEINPFIIIDTAGNITLVNPRPDMGQGSTQAVPSLLAEELEVSLEKVLIVQSDGNGKYGSQTSGGSSSVRELWMPIRKAGAAAREMLTTTAAKKMEPACNRMRSRRGQDLAQGQRQKPILWRTRG